MILDSGLLFWATLYNATRVLNNFIHRKTVEVHNKYNTI